MAKTTRAKRTAPRFPIPQNREQANEAIREIGIAQRELARIEANMNDELAAVREKYEATAVPMRDAITARIDGVQVWADANRAILTRDGKVKSATLPAGEISWRTTPPSVSVRGAEAVITRLHVMGLTQFIRRKEEVNKEAILETPFAHPVRQIEGITICQREEFAVVPFETELSEV
ncbi:host-nuclease inhibitor Gam family protein [Zoogloea sp. 1C4]|uniref:host-nuclease inhibitor Gam family protein n=1 Tax=Zoogloea sp. 1C4 TaxID=2570190 RepID=UPI0012909939|nr:host-nuclease inhibitor Gam family protein [Zoogloea sp. 1C4]